MLILTGDDDFEFSAHIIVIVLFEPEQQLKLRKDQETLDLKRIY